MIEGRNFDNIDRFIDIDNDIDFYRESPYLVSMGILASKKT